jgi:hypothetical protein
MTLTIIISVLFYHWISDFWLQSDYTAQNKSKDWGVLFDHCWTYTTAMAAFMLIVPMFLGQRFEAFPITLSTFSFFYLITFLSHFATDAITSRINSYLWKEKRVHDFFVSIGGDQLIHYTTLFLTIELLNGKVFS